MRVWNEEEGRMDEGDVTNVAPFIRTARQQIERMGENLRTVSSSDFENLKAKISEDMRRDMDVEILDYDQLQEVSRRAQEQLAKDLARRFAENEKDRELVLGAIPARKVKDHLHFNFDKIAKRYGFLSGDPEDDYQMFDQNSPRLKKLIREPAEQEREGVSFDFVYSDFYRKPVVLAESFDRDSVISEAYWGVKEILAKRAAESDPQVKELFERARCQRGGESPYFYPDNEIYDFIKTVSVEKAQQVLETDDRNISEQMTAFKVLKAMRYDIPKFEPDQLKKQLHQAYTLDRSGLWQYFAERNSTQIEQARAKLGEESKDNHWLELLGVKASRDQFREGKRMYWLAKQVWMHSPGRTEEDRFYKNDFHTKWDRYDLTKADVSEEKLNEYLGKHKNLIVALLSQDPEGYDNNQKEKPATLGLIIKALEKAGDIRGVALARDKQRYLEGVISGQVKNDLEFAVEDWPEDWRKAVSKEEIDIYYEYSGDYVFLDPNGLAKYAVWRATREGREWDEIFKESPERKSDLDLRICLGGQTEDVRGWYKVAAEYVGNTIMQNYLLRFNATRGTDGQIANWHDVLLWSPSIKKLEAKDAKSILSSIETMDDNQEFAKFLPRYSDDRDPLKDSGPIQSLRELKKRVLAIESNIDLSEFPPELLEITSAPGFNLSALETMRARVEFQDLMDGKLDKEQPFQPHSRTFVGRALTEALREGLGSQKKKIRGTAKDSKGLFFALNQLVKGREFKDRKMTVPDLLENVPTDLEEDVIHLLREQQVDVGPIVEAQIHAKSDPEGWVCGNYTDCCMAFGKSIYDHGSTVYPNDGPNCDGYMFNPSTQYFTIKYNGRIVAQSVVVDSRDRKSNEDVIVLDNVEVANNYKNLSPLLANVYQTFWTEYTSKSVKVGTGHSDLTPPGGRLEENHYQPKTRLSYSDADGPKIYDLPKRRGIESMDKMITFGNIFERDIELISRMEEEAYPDEMVQGKDHIAEILQKQRDLEVPGAASSFLVRQGKEPAGYLLVLPEESEVQSGEQVAHIYDIVVLPKFRGSPVARKMMERVLDVASAYEVSIEAEARASTSYALLMNERVRRWFESKGFYLTKNEKLPEYLGGEDFYFVRFENRKEDVDGAV